MTPTPEAPSGWRPIESAPKEMVLCYHPEIPAGQSKLRALMRVGFAHEWPNRPATHWMPLPAPPTESAPVAPAQSRDAQDTAASLPGASGADGADTDGVFCRFPDCKCPMDPGPEPDWCANTAGVVPSSSDQQEKR